MEQQFLEFPEKTTTSRGIPKVSKISYREFSFHSILLQDFILGILGCTIRFSEIQHFSDFPENFPGNF